MSLTSKCLSLTRSYYPRAVLSCHMSTAVPDPPPPPAPKPFSSIPKKKGVRKYFDYFGPQPHHVVFSRIKELGPLFREKVPAPIPEMVMVCDPKDAETVIRADGKFPIRQTLPQWNEIFSKLKIPKSFALSNEYEEWYQGRRPVAKFLMVPRKVAESHEGLNEVAMDTVHAIRKLRTSDTNELNHVISLLNKWAFESAAYFALGKRLGALNIGNVPEDCQEFIDHIINMFGSTYKLMMNPLPLYKIWPTKQYKLLYTSMKGQFDIATKFIEEKLKEIKENDEKLNASDSEDATPPDGVDFLTYMILKGEMSLDEISSMSNGLMTAGVDTTSNTLGWALYCLAINPDVQSKLRNDIMSVVGKEDIVTPEHIHNLPYLRHCIRESQRMYPVATNNMRTLNKDIVLSGYHVPKGTEVSVQTYAMGWLPEIFPEPEVYKPERWDKTDTTLANNFASFPFGFGPRMCVGRRFAELELYITLAHIVRSFDIGFPEDKPMGTMMRLVLVPERDLNLSFVDL